MEGDRRMKSQKILGTVMLLCSIVAFLALKDLTVSSVVGALGLCLCMNRNKVLI